MIEDPDLRIAPRQLYLGSTERKYVPTSSRDGGLYALDPRD